MTTASVYYNRHTGDPDYILIDGDRADVVPVSNVMGGDWKLRDVGAACRRLGWKVMGEAKIVRQADGRGTVVIEPLPVPSAVEHLDPVQALHTGTAYVTQEASADEANMYVVVVAVDGRRETYTTSSVLGALDPAEDHHARVGVEESLTSMGYVRSGPLVQEQPGTWCCTADPADKVVTDRAEVGVAMRVRPEPPVARIAVNPEGVPKSVWMHGGGWAAVHTLCSLTSGTPDAQRRAMAAVDDALSGLGYIRTKPPIRSSEPGYEWQAEVITQQPGAVEDWRDAVTLVRMGADTAGLLTWAAETLGIPADTLASTWIRQAAVDALSRQERFLSPGYIADHLRITGWLPDGTPTLRD